MTIVAGKRSSRRPLLLRLLIVLLLALLQTAAAASIGLKLLRGAQLVEEEPPAPKPLPLPPAAASKQADMDDAGSMPPLASADAPRPTVQIQPTCPEGQCLYNCRVDDEGDLSCFCGVCP